MTTRITDRQINHRTDGIVTGATTLDFTYGMVLCDASGGAITINLPAAAANVGRAYTIKKIDSSANTVTIDGDSGETIDDLGTQVISYQYTSITITCDGSEWWII